MKKALVLILCLLMCVSMFSSAAMAEEPTTFTFMVPCNSVNNLEGSAGDIMWTKVVSSFEEKYPQYKVDAITVGQNADDYNAAWSMAASANNLADLTWGAQGMAYLWAPVGLLEDMSKYADEPFYDRFVDGAVDAANEYATVEGVYSLPGSCELQGWFYNTALFEKYGLELPETWDDFMNCIKVFQENGVTPIVHGGLDIWAVWGYHYMFTTYGLTYEMAKQLESGELKFKDCEPFVRVYERLAELAASGAFNDDITTTLNDVASARFVAGEVPMYGCYGGIVATWEGLKETGESDLADHCVYSYGPTFPDAVERTGLRTFNWVFQISSKAGKDEKKMEAILAFLNHYYSEEMTDIIVNYQNPVVKIEQDPNAEITMLRASYNEQQASGEIKSVGDPVADLFDPSVKPAYRNAITGLISGTLTVDDALTIMQDWADTL